MRTSLAALAVLLGFSCTGPCGAAEAAPIVGFWTFKGGVIQVRAGASGYEGVVVKKPQSGDCAEPVGYLLLKLKGSGNHYTGSEEWWTDPTCERRYSDDATIDVSGATAHLCSGDPFPGPPPSECVDMQRLKSFP